MRERDWGWVWSAAAERERKTQVKHKYRIASNVPVPVAKKSPELLLEGSQKDSPKAQKKDINTLADLSRMRGMTAQEATAAQAIAEAEVAIAEVEEAAREPLESQDTRNNDNTGDKPIKGLETLVLKQTKQVRAFEDGFNGVK
ncbi:hypothetical protein ACOSP7_001163 [Xanthoceras sorbifolium]